MDRRQGAWRNRGAIWVGAVTLTGAYGAIGWRVLLARRQGLGPSAALWNAVAGEGWYSWVAFTVFMLAISLLICRLCLPVASDGARLNAAREQGSRRWHHMRTIYTVWTLVLIALQASYLLLRLRHNRLEAHDWILFAATALLIIFLIAFWRRKPTPDLLYALGSGDDSRLDDERAREVTGRSASTTLGIILVAIILVGAPYEVLVQSVFPVRSLVEFWATVMLWSLTREYWNRRF